MNLDQRMDQLEQEIRQLAKEHNDTRQRLVRLYDELRLLRTQAGNPSQTAGAFAPPDVPESADEWGDLQQERYLATAPARGQQPLAQHGLEHFIGLRLIHLAGIIVLLTGISLGIKYAIDKDLISPLARIMLAYFAGIILLVISLRLKARYNFFSAILFSGSMACCYFTTYGALVYYQFLATSAAFFIMVALTVFTVVQSIYYNRIEIALIGLVGAYGIPFLVSNNTGRMDLFFAYVLLINTAVVFLGFRKNWQLVTRLAMVITWTLYLGWLLLDYNSAAQQLTAVLFASAFYLLFILAAFAGKFFRKIVLGSTDIVQVVLLNGLLYLSAVLVFPVNDSEPLVQTAILLILVAAWAVLTRWKMPDERQLFRFLFIQSLCLLILYIGFRWDGITVTLLWITVSVLMFSTGVIKRAGWLRVCSVLLIGGTLLKLITLDAVRFTTGQRIVSFIVIGILLLIGSFYYQRINTALKK
ncbi:MAG: DUF2339 domain-containing protein [Chitinophagaceae bacterium]|nr:MAG: DUF2339 domain-containing protein [Chitinophagaceae bacterium]